MDIAKNSQPYPGFMAKKRLGQNFLIDQNIAQNFIDIIQLSPTDHICEIGSGFGVLTGRILETNATLVAIEIDTRLCKHLNEQFESYPNFKLIHGDVLNQNFIEISRKTKWRLVGNLPYHITSPLLFKVFEERQGIKDMTVMVQKEVAERIVSKHGNIVYGILSVLLQAFFDIEYLFTVKPGVFNPPPKVNSAVIRLTRNSVRHLDCDAKLFKQVVKKGFGKRRKTLRNALKDLNLPIELTSEDVFGQRAEQLSVAEFIFLTKKIESSWV